MANRLYQRRDPLLPGLLLGVALLSSAAVPAEAASASFVVSLSVPAACFIQAPGTIAVSDGATSSGDVTEACNVPGGYTVTASYRSLAADEGAVMLYDGQTISLPSDGQVIVRTSSVATVRQIAYQLTSTHLDSPLAVSLSITPV
jgi:hypothetical protein